VALGDKGPDTTSLSQEQTAANDREMACRIGGVADPNSIPLWTVLSEEPLPKSSTPSPLLGTIVIILHTPFLEHHLHALLKSTSRDAFKETSLPTPHPQDRFLPGEKHCRISLPILVRPVP
jgi:hypothetical protein